MFNLSVQGAYDIADRKIGFLSRWLGIEWQKSLEEAIEFLGWETPARRIINASWSISFLVILCTLGFSGILFYWGMSPVIPLFIGLFAATFLAYFLSTYPARAANKLKLKALGSAPDLVAYLIIALKQNPSLEEAARFAGEHGEGKMAEDLKKGLRDVWMGKYRSVGEFLPVLGYKWGREIRGFEDAMYAIRTSQIEKSESRRLNTLDRALESVLCSIQERFDEFINYLKLPTMVIFAGGALFPLVVIILLPIISFMGFDYAKPLNLALILSGIVFFVYLFSEYTLEKRPAAFSPIRIPEDYPGLPKKGKMRFLGKEGRVLTIASGLGLGICALAIPYFLGSENPLSASLTTLPVVWGCGVFFYAYMQGSIKDRLAVWEKIKRIEDETVEAGFQIGNRLVSGVSAEEAISKVAAMMNAQGSEKSPMAEMFKKATKNIKYLNMNLSDAFFDPQKGALKDVCSGLVTSTFWIFTIAMKKSINAASEALMVAAGHIREIRKVESELRKKMAYTTSMIKATALLINPAICAIAVHISVVFRKTMADTRALRGEDVGVSLAESSISPELLQMITGLYMIGLLVVLVRYIVILERGDDSIMQKKEIAKGIPVALLSFSGILFATSFI